VNRVFVVAASQCVTFDVDGDLKPSIKSSAASVSGFKYKVGEEEEGEEEKILIKVDSPWSAVKKRSAERVKRSKKTVSISLRSISSVDQF
jgi:hypothetical protein